MAVDRRQGQRDLAAKLKLEAKFRPEIRAVHGRIVRQFTRSVRPTGRVPSVGSGLASLLEPILLKHYRLVAAEFSTRLSEQMPKDVAVTGDERDEIDARLRVHFEKRARTRATYMGRTTQRDAAFAVRLAREERERARADGREVTAREFAVYAGALFGRKCSGRENVRTCFETQSAAETSKHVELEVLAGFDVYEEKARGRRGGSRVEQLKEWTSQGDDIVRPWHLRADGQTRPVQELYVVMGERLLFPGDTTHGATARNVMNCRCASVVDPEPLIIQRRDELEDVPPPTPPKPKPRKKPVAKKPKKAPAKKPGAAAPSELLAREELLEKEGIAAFSDLGMVPGFRAETVLNLEKVKAGWTEAIHSIRASLQANEMPNQQMVSRIFWTREEFEMEGLAWKTIIRDSADWGLRDAQRFAYRARGGRIKPPSGKRWRFNHFNFNEKDAIAQAREELDELGYTRELLKRKVSKGTMQERGRLMQDLRGSLKLMNAKNDVRLYLREGVPAFTDDLIISQSAGSALRNRIVMTLDELADGGMAAGNLFDSTFLKTIYWDARETVRAHAIKGTNEIVLAANEKQQVIAHEFGHHLEFRNPDVKDRVLSWRKSRTLAKGEAQTPIYRGTTEMGYRDGFYEHYVGKTYGDGSTEVLSMGLEAFFSTGRLGKMLIKDQEHFELMWSILRGY